MTQIRVWWVEEHPKHLGYRACTGNMDTPNRDDTPDISWTYRGHQCYVYTATDPVDGDTFATGYVKTKLPAGEDSADLNVSVPGEFTTDRADGWIGFSTASPSDDIEQMTRAVELFVDDLLELEITMDG